MPNIGGMNATEVKSIIDQIAEETGHKQTTVCQRVLGNPLYYERLGKRIEQDAKSGKKFQDYLAQVTAKKQQEAAE